MSALIEKVPARLKKLPQWVCWRYEIVSGRETKIPYTPATGHKANILKPATWSSFRDAVKASKDYDGVGFVLVRDNNITIIDLDNKPHAPCTPEQLKRHDMIYSAFDSYTERSVSKTGVHIIVEGCIPAGVHRDNVEAYCEHRYMAFTGDILRDRPIENYQDRLDKLFKEIQPAAKAILYETGDTIEDYEIFEMASNAVNADKFNMLCRGEWEADYESQSDADHALLAILSFYTQSDEQVRRLFRMSELGKRTKATRDDKYIDFSLQKIRAKQPAPVDLTNLNLAIKSVDSYDLKTGTLEVTAEAVKKTPPRPAKSIYPPGLVGDLARYIYSSAIRPVPELALIAALGLMAGVAGRAYNISGTGLNQYLILVAKTGMGKEGISSGIDAIISATRKTVPSVDEFIGPSAFASGQALVKVLDHTPCFVSVLGEVGLTLQQICDPRANAAQITMRRVLLDLYAKSGIKKVLRPSVYSDQDKNTRLVQAPNVTILGETTPHTLYDGIDQTHISEGLIPRFTVIEYLGKRPPANKNPFGEPDEELIKRFIQVVTAALTTANNHTCANVGMDKGAKALFDKLDVMADAKINGAHQDVEMQLWNRAHLKALKLGALIAVGINPHQPTISEEVAVWAIDFITNEVSSLVNKFVSGAVGQGDHRQELDVREAFQAYLDMDEETRKKYGVPTKVLSEKGIVPYAYLRRRLRLLAAFKNDRKGANLALKMCLDDMCTGGVIQVVPPQQVRTTFGLNSSMYIVGESW